MCQCNILFLSAILACSVMFVTSFNVDKNNYAVYSGERDSMFGFTVAIHKSQNQAWILVGAPEAQSRQYQAFIRKSGVVYKCPADTDGNCHEVPFDTKANNLHNSSAIDEKENQWFGATLSTSGSENGPVVACAPRYVWFTENKTRKDPVGTCYVSNGQLSDFNEYSPCRVKNQWGYHRQGYCQAGFSAAINNKGDRLFTGAPGSWYWQGQMLSIDAKDARFPFMPLFSSTFGSGVVHKQDLTNRPAVFSTHEGSEKDDDSYMGYSTITGNFFGPEDQGIAVGMPRGNELHGKVLLFTWNLTNSRNFSGDQIGSYFGYALTAADVDGDKLVDLIIGSPMYTVANTEGKYDVGRVSVIYQKNGYTSANTLDGFNSKSRFGQSLASLGDINQDGYGDFAVGAPYDGPFERGAVYIYHGSKNGVRGKYSQRIFAEDVQGPERIPVSTFGFSISGGIDLDGNEYPDMVVGSYLSNNAFFFRSRPVVRVEAFVKFQGESKEINIADKNCQYGSLSDQSGVCTNIQFCIKYSGKAIPSAITLTLQYILDSGVKTPRMGFLERDTHTYNETVTIYKGREQTCQTKRVYVMSEMRDKLSPLEAEVKYWMHEGLESFSHTREPSFRLQLKPILDLNSPLSRKDYLVVKKNCSSDKCVPNLGLKVSPGVTEYLLNSHKHLAINVVIVNTGEDAFEATFEMQFPMTMNFKKIDDKSPTIGYHLCIPNKNHTVKCDVGNPLPAGKIVKFTILLESSQIHQMMDPTYEFDCYVNSTNPEENFTKGDNHVHFSVNVMIDTKLALNGESLPADIHYNSSMYTSETILKESDIGPAVTHVYYLANNGSDTLSETEIFLIWPYQTLGGDDLLYLLHQPQHAGNVKCDIAPANYKKYQINHQNIFEKWKINTSGSEYSGQKGGTSTIGGSGISVETGNGIRGSVGSTSQNKYGGNIDTGDGSNIHLQRQNASYHQQQGNDQGGATITTTTETKYATKFVNGQPVTTVFQKRVYDKNGNLISQGINDFHYQQNPLAYVQGSRKYGIILDNTTSYIYTSSGSGSQMAGGSTTYVDSKYPGENPTSTSSKHFSWSGPGQQQGGSYSGTGSSQQGGGYYQQGGSYQTGSGTSYQQGRLYQQGGSTSSQEHNFQGASGEVYGQSGGSYQQGSSRQHGGSYQQQGGESSRGSGRYYNQGENYHQQAGHRNEQGGGSYQQGGSSGSYNKQDSVISSGGSYNQDRTETDNEPGTQSHYYQQSGSQDQQSGSRHEQSGGSYQGQGVVTEERNYQEGGRHGQSGSSHREGTYHQQGSTSAEGSSNRGGTYHQQGSTSAGASSNRGGTYHQQGSSSAEGSYQEGGSESSEGAGVGSGYFDERGVFHASGQTHKQSNINIGGVIGGHGFRTQQFDLGKGGTIAVTEGSAAGGDFSNRQTGSGHVSGTGSDGSYHQSSSSASSSSSSSNARFDPDLGYYVDEQGNRVYSSGQQLSSGSTSSSSSQVHFDPDLGYFVNGQGKRVYTSNDRHSSGSGGIGRGEWQREGSWSISKSGGSSAEDQQNTGRKQDWHREGSWSQSGTIPPVYFDNIERDNVPTDRPDPNSYPRGKRAINNNNDINNSDYNPYADIESKIQCKATKCYYIRCTAGPLRPGQQVAIALAGRINARTLRKIGSTQPITFSSMMASRISRLPYIGPPIKRNIHINELYTTVPAPEAEIKPDIVPLWVVVLSAVAGTIILLLLIFLLYKFGFFKRNRPSNAPERQPLNRNGYHHGDEAL